MAAADAVHSEAVFTAPPGVPFLDAVARAILAGDLPRPGGAPPSIEGLADVTILLPTRRAVRHLTEAILVASGRRAVLLPNIRPIGEGDEDLGLLDGLLAPGNATGFGKDAAHLDLPPAISAIERRLTLTRLVLMWSKALRARAETDARPLSGPSTPAQAARFADDLGRLIDMLETEGVSPSRLAGLVPDAFAEHWQETVEF
ncbi:MAG TPA: double-strand break repair protein AddB, partial [Hyphomicrobiaceae bacterium]|nr:double-strand break repair protein AddB [Hyphomicrobiaceae bacterium]